MTVRTRTDHIIVHCSATTPDMDIGASEIDRWHTKKGWNAIGYHYVIRRSGCLETGRPENIEGAHCKAGGRNHDSIGICLVGGVTRTDDERLVPESNFTRQQYVTLTQLLQNLKYVYKGALISGHRDHDPSKSCPSFDVKAFWYGALTLNKEG